MILTFVTECRFYKTPDGNYYADDISYSNNLWFRYLKEFTKVIVVARIFNTCESFDESLLVNNVEFSAVYPYDTIFSFSKNILKIKKDLRKSLIVGNITIIRGAGPLGFLAGILCNAKDIKYGLEVIGDPYDVYAPTVVRHPLRPFLRRIFTYFQKKTVASASAVTYVTKSTLQKRYPPSKTAYVTYASDVFLEKGKIVSDHKKFTKEKVINLISIGSLNQMYKSPDILIQAVKKLSDMGIDTRLVWLGNGKFLDDMQKLACDLGIDDKINFVGAVSANEVTKYLDASDIFLLVSRTEGLPRAVVEAMARGLPCIGTNVGGIPELLDKVVLVKPECPESIVRMVEYFIINKVFTNEQAKKNLNNSRQYSFENLNSKRIDFYRFLKTNLN